ncbi:hypothetical protein ACP70R_037819 [Stipagrostis hirtigluma subsp. patula]
MEGSMGSRVCQSAGSFCWTRRRSYHYQRLPAATPTTPRQSTGRGVRRGRRVVLGSTAWRFGRPRRAVARWSPLQLLNRIVSTYISSMLPQSLKTVKAAVPSAAAAAAPLVMPCEGASSTSPARPRRGASSSSRRSEVHGRGVMLNICVAEVLLLRRSSSEVRRSPLHRRKDEPAPGARASVRP